MVGIEVGDCVLCNGEIYEIGEVIRDMYAPMPIIRLDKSNWSYFWDAITLLDCYMLTGGETADKTCMFVTYVGA